MATTLAPFLNFNQQCAEAFRFYHRILGGELTVQTFGDSPMRDHVPAEMLDAVLTARLVIDDDAVLTGCDVQAGLTVKPEGFEVALGVRDADDAARIYAALAEEGEVTMPLQETFAAKRFGMVTDRYGIPWMVTCE